MVKKNALGKGLGALIPGNFNENVDKLEKNEKLTTDISTKPVDNVNKPVENLSAEQEININLVEPNRSQPRTKFDEESLKELSESIKQHGIIQPILVCANGKRYTIVAGERRWRAAKLAGLKKVPVIVKEFSAQEVAEIALIENIQREDLNPIEEANAYRRLIDEFNMKQEDMAARVSKSRSAITNRLRLLKLDERVQTFLANGEISEGHARAILALAGPEQQFDAASQVIASHLSVRDTEKLVKVMQKPIRIKNDAWKERDQAVYENLAMELRKKLGTKVNIQRTDEAKGRIQIDYYSVDELERLMDIFKSIREQ